MTRVMIVEVSTHLPAPPEKVWDYVQTPRLLQHVAAPLVIFRSRERGGFPEKWAPGPHRVWMLAFGLIPLGPQTVGIEIGPHEASVYRVRDNGSGLLARTWDHHITIKREGADTHYTDHVRIEAGFLTPLVWAFASIFYRWRQMRWRVLVRRGFRY
jgi:ligand-binding SRPBCC domain-containing protein